MFGTVTIHQPELKFKDYEIYRSFYCGVCRSLKKHYGPAGQSTLSYDMTFLALLLSALYEPETAESTTWCVPHPLVKHPLRSNEFVDYAADMNILLAYWQRLDGWKDDRKLRDKVGADALKKAYEKAKKAYPRQAEAVEEYVRELSRCEAENDTNLDTAAGLTGRMLGEIFVCKEDEWAPVLRRVGFYLGKFIYLTDAYEDFDKDKKKGAYNPWNGSGAENRAALAEKVRDVLNMMMSECCLAFEYLPILMYGDILRNILYAGVWLRCEAAAKEDREAADKAAGKAEDAKAAAPGEAAAENGPAVTDGKEDSHGI